MTSEVQLDEATDPRIRQLEQHFEQLKRERWFEGQVRGLERRFPNRPEWTEDAVAAAFEMAVRAETVFPSVDDLKNWLYRVAFNDMRRRAKREAKRPLPPWELERRDARPAEEEAIEAIAADELYDELRAHIRTWPNARRRVVADYILDAERQGEPHSGMDVVDHVRDVLGDEISVKTAWKLTRIVLAQLNDYIAGVEPVEQEEQEDDE